MALNVDDLIEGLGRTRRGRVEKLAAEFIAEEMTLRELRKARKLTQVSLARELGISQDGISRMERRSDLLLSTLRKTVEAMGGSLSLVARFPDRPPVELAGIAEPDRGPASRWILGRPNTETGKTRQRANSSAISCKEQHRADPRRWKVW